MSVDILAPPDHSSNNDAMERRRKPLYQERVDLGKAVEQLRTARRWSKATLARRAKVSAASILALETARKTTQHRKLQQVAKALGTTVEGLKTTKPDDVRRKDLNDEDYEIAQWFHHAPRLMKNRVWALREGREGADAFTDPTLVPLIEGWTNLTPEDRSYILKSYNYVQQHSANRPDLGVGGVDGVPTVPHKVRPPQR